MQAGVMRGAVFPFRVAGVGRRFRVAPDPSGAWRDRVSGGAAGRSRQGRLGRRVRSTTPPCPARSRTGRLRPRGPPRASASACRRRVPGRDGRSPVAGRQRRSRRPACGSGRCAPSRRGRRTRPRCTARRGSAGRRRPRGRTRRSSRARRESRRAERRLVVGQVGERRAVRVDAVADGRAGMADQRGGDAERARSRTSPRGTSWRTRLHGRSRSRTGKSGGDR